MKGNVGGEKIAYAEAGVDYSKLDAFKEFAQKAGEKTILNMNRLGVEFLSDSMGQSAQLFELLVNGEKIVIGSVVEALGTKYKVADEMKRITGKCYYESIGQDLAAMILNDLVASGVIPVNMNMLLAVGNSNWFDDEERYTNLIRGCVNACDIAGCSYIGGETPVLVGTIYQNEVVLAGSTFGRVRAMSHRVVGSNIQEGDVIVGLASSGIHSNGLTLARKIVENFPNGYATVMSNGALFGEALLKPTLIYVPVIEECLDKGLEIHYISNITGHGWEKIARADKVWTYVIDNVPKWYEEFFLIQDHENISDYEMYRTFNMGIGLVIIAPEKDVAKIIQISQEWFGIPAMVIGFVEASNVKRVVIEPLGIEYNV